MSDKLTFVPSTYAVMCGKDDSGFIRPMLVGENGKLPPSNTSSAKNADYPISDSDGLSIIRMTAGSSTDKTATLPLASNNLDRKITLIKADAGTKNAILDGKDAEEINGYASINLRMQGDRLTVISNGVSWDVIDSYITYDSGWVSLADWTDATITITHNLGVNIPYLDEKIYASASGADGADNYNISYNTTLTSVWFGTQPKGNNAASIIIQTGSNGPITLDSSGSGAAIVSGYYRVMLRRKL